jgi:hypothetical protein
VRTFRRFFKRFKQSIRRSVVHPVGIVDYEKTASSFVRAKVCFRFEMTDRIDGDRSVVSDDQADIRVIAKDNAFVSVFVVGFRQLKRRGTSARRANSAGFTVGLISTKERANQLDREGPLPDAFVTRK